MSLEYKSNDVKWWSVSGGTRHQQRDGRARQLIACGRRRAGPPRPSRTHHDRHIHGYNYDIKQVYESLASRLHTSPSPLSIANPYRLRALEDGPLGGGAGGAGGGALGALRPTGSPPAPSLGASRHSLIDVHGVEYDRGLRAAGRSRTWFSYQPTSA
ncbi:hypothetical protein RR46_10653 [Papilio xuthus]|uniref:Uncharacterized protein n=1 Tax=Papilio xuthus TaxID=66420 RepID=A0A194PK51_PAPXU|nr:hypothetical protein RR46_10653 [Papilio xuthus]